MNLAVLGELIRLRYKLLWAKTRSRNGRIALFFSGYILLILLFAVLMAGGFGAAIVAVRSGKAELVAQAVFSGIFVQALLASIILGFGMDTVFSETELRRYPVKARERRLVRHVIGIADPFWALFLVLELGVVVGLYVFGNAPVLRGLFAVLLLTLANYLLARIISLMIWRLMQRKSGSAWLMLFLMSAALLPPLIPPLLKGPSLGPAMAVIFRYTPPASAAAAASRYGLAGWAGLGSLACWLAGLTAIIVWLERRPPIVRRVETGKVSWDSWYERLAAMFPNEDAPFVAHWLRFHMRNSRFRVMYLLSVPLIGFVVFSFSRRGGMKAFEGALGIFAILGFFATSRIAVNQYGYVGGGFRRYFLLPTDPAASLRAGAYASMLIGSALIPVGLLAWIAFAPVPFDIRMVLMLLGSAITGLFLFHGLGLWVSLFNPRKGDYESSFGNDLSLWGNIVLIGGMINATVLPQVLAKFAPALMAPENWWITLATVALAAAFFVVSLRASAGLLLSRRERLLAMAEGRD